jgi:hypothetical protein
LLKSWSVLTNHESKPKLAKAGNWNIFFQYIYKILTKYNGRGLPICRSLACKSSRCLRNQIETASKPQQAKKQVLIARYKKRKKNKNKQVKLMFLFWIQAAQNYLPEAYQF